MRRVVSPWPLQGGFGEVVVAASGCGAVVVADRRAVVTWARAEANAGASFTAWALLKHAEPCVSDSGVVAFR